ncbi:hypothetical protein ACIQZB_39795 [Streptomyces sp. NPDC097727]|uniref:hypothetical protein n=1 Tax=Streptomyces sp. NPDC097727 TaxID=3366092 RepID=UPI00381CD304
MQREDRGTDDHGGAAREGLGTEDLAGPRYEEVLTEDLRIALQRYRSFFNRLLST